MSKIRIPKDLLCNLFAEREGAMTRIEYFRQLWATSPKHQDCVALLDAAILAERERCVTIIASLFDTTPLAIASGASIFPPHTLKPARK